MATPEELLTAVDEVISDGVRRGLLHNDVEDEVLDGRHITVLGRRLVNFGSCSYLGLETDPRLKAAVRDAVDRFGTQFSSSRAYASSPLYRVAEESLAELFGRPTVITPSTSMGHIATMPTLITGRDALLLDHQVHHSVQTAAKLAQAAGAHVELVPHSDLRTLERRLEAFRGSHRRVWYAVDGLYSMYADFFPAAELDELAARYENLWLYVDDAHAASWTGRHGRGYALEHLSEPTLARTVVAVSLNKSFAAAGGAITFPDQESRRLVATVGGPLNFSGPVQPPMLGAIVASARLHRSPEIAERQALLRSRIRLFNRLSADAGLPVVSESEAPIRYVGAGVASVAYRLTERLRDAGFFVNTATFPAVPAKRCGARLTVTAHHTDDDVAGVVDALAEHLPLAITEEGATVDDLRRAFARQLRGRPEVLRTRRIRRPRPALRLEHTRSVDRLDTAEWDRLLGNRGAMESSALRTLEAVFGAGGTGGAGQTEDAWDFLYFVVRDADGVPVAATFFTTALWKDDMLSPPHVSREVERRRTETADSYFLTSPMVAMGSLLTEGDHLYLDRSRDWRGALRLILQAARAEEDAAGAAAVVLRDLPDGDEELHAFLLGEGLIRIPVWDTWVREIDFADDEEFLAQLSSKHRAHQRRNVLPFDGAYDVEWLRRGGRAVSDAELDHLYGLYLNVQQRGRDLNSFPLPKTILRDMLAHDSWELMTLTLRETGEVVAFGAHFLGARHYAPMVVGLDYRYVRSHGAYRQALRRALVRGRELGAKRVLLGMGATFETARFGAHVQGRVAFAQTNDHYSSEVLAALAADSRSA
jgi:7-keto-8-aminopelargonate synthetase-like enzyme